ncbi:adenosine deaminase [Enterococcus sp. LJL99]
MQKTVVKKLPKIELHCHLDGSIRPKTLVSIAEKQQLPLPEDFEQIKKEMIAPANCQSLEDYLTCFDFVLPYLQTEAALTEAAYDVLSQAAEENVHYIEVRFAPSLHTENGLTHTQIITAVLSGLNQGFEAFGVKSNALLCGMRHEELTEIKKIVHLAEQFKEKGIVGFDLAGNESDFPPNTFKDVLNLATELTIPLTLHAGECGCGKNVADAVKLGATRIGHGIAVKDTPEFFSLLRENDILIEMCPTSNFQTKTVQSIEEYPFKQFLAEKIKICINTDNRTVSNTSLTDEYLNLHKWYNISYADLEQLNHFAVDGAFLPTDEKQALHELLAIAYKQ